MEVSAGTQTAGHTTSIDKDREERNGSLLTAFLSSHSFFSYYLDPKPENGATHSGRFFPLEFTIKTNLHRNAHRAS